jgi:II/X family phage/plasmid replication protein
LLWAVDSALIPEGSWGEKLTLRTPETGLLVVSGNPTKFLQGHNLFGSDELVPLVVAATLKALRLIQDKIDPDSSFAQVDLTPPDEYLAKWLSGDFVLSRIDLTAMFAVGSTADVRSWLRVAGDGARMKWKNRVYDQGTLYLGRAEKGKRAKDESWKFYCKRDELDAHKLPASLSHRGELLAWAEGKLRGELTLRTRVLKKLGLRFGRDWSAERVVEVYLSRWEQIQLSDNAVVPVEIVQELPKHLREPYLAWKDGMDPQALYSRATLYRHRKQILERLGLDILVPAPKSNVISLPRVLTITPATIPDFARGTSLLFEPSRAA